MNFRNKKTDDRCKLLTRARNSDFVASYDDNSLSSKEFLGYNTSEATKKVVAAVDNLRLR
jgi:hypothetical protein